MHEAENEILSEENFDDGLASGTVDGSHSFGSNSGLVGGEATDKRQGSSKDRGRSLAKPNDSVLLGAQFEPFCDSSRIVGNPEVILDPLGGGHLDV
jgi:hypothetical protein